MQLAPKGATPRIVVVDVREIQARVDEIDYDARIAVLTGPEGNRVKVKVDEQVADLNAVNTGDIVVVRYNRGFEPGNDSGIAEKRLARKTHTNSCQRKKECDHLYVVKAQDAFTIVTGASHNPVRMAHRCQLFVRNHHYRWVCQMKYSKRRNDRDDIHSESAYGSPMLATASTREPFPAMRSEF